MVCALLPFCLWAQDTQLVGVWDGTGKGERATLQADGNLFFAEFYKIGTQSRTRVLQHYYAVIGEKVFLLTQPFKGEVVNPVATFGLAVEGSGRIVLTGKDGYRFTFDKKKDKAYISPYRLDEFSFEGGVLGCLATSTSHHFYPCMKFGDISLEALVEEIDARYGSPHNSYRNQDGSQTNMYLLPTNESEFPYLAVTFKGSQILSLQLSGQTTTEKLHFSSIILGDYSTYVTQILGPPTDKTDITGEDDAELWNYAPYPILIEIRGERVSSIKLSRE